MLTAYDGRENRHCEFEFSDLQPRHASLGSPEPINLKTASRSVQPFLHSSRQRVSGLFVPWTFRRPTLDHLYPLPNIDCSYPRLFVPWTLDRLYPRLFVPRPFVPWTVRTLNHLADVVAKLLNVSFASGQIYANWKMALVTPVPKVATPTLVISDQSLSHLFCHA